MLRGSVKRLMVYTPKMNRPAVNPKSQAITRQMVVQCGAKVTGTWNAARQRCQKTSHNQSSTRPKNTSAPAA